MWKIYNEGELQYGAREFWCEEIAVCLRRVSGSCNVKECRSHGVWELWCGNFQCGGVVVCGRCFVG